MSVPLPAGAVQICSINITVEASGSTALIAEEMAFQNAGSSIADIWLYLVIDGNTTAVQSNWNDQWLPGFTATRTHTDFCYNLSAGSHTLTLYAVSGMPSVSYVSAGISPLVFGA